MTIKTGVARELLGSALIVGTFAVAGFPTTAAKAAVPSMSGFCWHDGAKGIMYKSPVFQTSRGDNDDWLSEWKRRLQEMGLELHGWVTQCSGWKGPGALEYARKMQAGAKQSTTTAVVVVEWAPRGASGQANASENRGGSESRMPTSSGPLPSGSKGPTPNQLKYQRELEEHRQRLAEIEKIKAVAAAQLERSRQKARQVVNQHQGEMDQHRQEVAAAEAAQRQYERELAAHRSVVEKLQKEQDRGRKVDWREAVVVCALRVDNPQSQFGNWRCDGPLQFTYAKLGGTGAASPQALTALSQACGGSTRSIRDIGLVGIYRVFGCSFGLHPQARSGFHLDAAAKYGLGYIPGRAVYRCSSYESSCRTY